MIRGTLAGVELLVLGELSWTFTAGLQPFQRKFYCHRSELQKLLDTRTNPDGVELVIENDDPLYKLTVKKLYVLRQLPTDHPDLACVVVSDIRWKWRYKWLLRRYNIKRSTGNRRLVTGDKLLELEQTSVDRLNYAKFSLRPETGYTIRWDARDVIRDVFGQVTDWSAVVIDDALFATALEVSDLMIDDDGVGAVARALALLPGATCRVDEFGTVQIYNSVDGKEEDVVRKFDDQVYVGGVLPEKVSMAMERPSKIIVHFPCEDEIRFNYVEGVTYTQDDESRYLVNVMPLPITVTYTSGDLSGQTVPAGTWVPIDDAMLSSIAAVYPPMTPAQRTLPIPTMVGVRYTWCNGGYNVWMSAFSANGADPVWGVVLSAIRQHYRQTFRVSRWWSDRILQYLPRRVALLDSVNMVWGKPTVYANYALIPSFRTIGRKIADPTPYVYNRTPFATPAQLSDIDNVDPDTIRDQQAQAEVTVLDHELGIFHIDYFVDPIGRSVGIVPSNVEGHDPADPMGSAASGLPSAQVDANIKVLSQSQLTSTHGLSLILTCLTGSPNDLGQTWAEEVDLFKAKQVLPDAVRAQLPDALGPEMHIHAPSYSARFAWIHRDRTYIENYVLGLVPRGRDAILNMVNSNFIDDMATAIAANVYSKMVDHYEGEVAGFLPDQTGEGTALGPRGRVGAVEHGVREGGVVYAKAELPPPSPKGLDVWSLMPEFARRYLRRILP